MVLDEPKRTGLSLPPLAAVTGNSYSGHPARADTIAARQNADPFAGRTAPPTKGQQSSQSPSASISKGMKFESLQLPLPYNISFGRKPLPRSEHRPKPANCYDPQDIPGERKSIKDLTLTQEQAASPSPVSSQGPPKAQHPPYFPNLPRLSPQSGDGMGDDGLEPNADPLSVLAHAGRIVGRESRRS